MEHRPDEWLGLELDLDNDHALIETLAGDLHCPLCGSPYEPSAIHFVRERHGAVTLAVQCYHCGSGSLLSLVLPLRALPQPTELTPVERAFFAYLAPISDADVQRIRRLLRVHCGDLRDLI